MRSLALAVTFVVVTGCGEGVREAGAVPSSTVFWKVASSGIEFGACSDDPAFRSQLQPVAFEANSYFIYKVSEDGKKAVSQNCTGFLPKDCVPDVPELAFDVAGNELLLNESSKSPLGQGGCQLTSTQAWTATDQGTTMTLDVANALSLTDDPTDCDQIETQVKAQSPNGVGYQGCVITYKIGFTLHTN